MPDHPRLIEQAFPLREASLDSAHEKSVRHGHISTLHLWPARRPLAACRAVLLATLLPDPGDTDKRRKLCEKIGGRVVKKIKRKTIGGLAETRETEETEGGLLHWGREMENHADLDELRQEIRKAYDGHPPQVLDPFAGGGAIPFEALRLGCKVTAADLNPVAWFVLKGALEYPVKLAGQVCPLPEFTRLDENFLDFFYKTRSHPGGRAKKTSKKARSGRLSALIEAEAGHPPEDLPSPVADLAWQIRAWGRRVWRGAKRELAAFYPLYADFEPLEPSPQKPFKPQPRREVPIKEDGSLDIEALNSDFNQEYLKLKSNPRWLAKPTVAYLWARTAVCKNCRAELPLLKTSWLCKKERKRVMLRLTPRQNKTGVDFDVEPVDLEPKGTPAQKREHDKPLGVGTMYRSGAQCRCCGAIMTMEDLRLEGQAGRLGALLAAVVVEGPRGKEYRLPEKLEIKTAGEAESALAEVFSQIPFGLLEEPTPKGGSGASRAFSVDGYGFKQWRQLFTPRQMLALGLLLKHTRAVRDELAAWPPEWAEAISAYLALALDKAADYGSTICTWHNSREIIGHTFARFALPITWDFTELALTNEVGGAYLAQLEWVGKYLDYALKALAGANPPEIIRRSAIQTGAGGVDLIVTDPPYYDAIPYSDLMDFFHVWLRRSTFGLSPEMEAAFAEPLSPKWAAENNDGELIDDSSRHGGDRQKSKETYEDGMARAFLACHEALAPAGRLVIVFAHKHPAAWETLVSAIIRAGFVVTASWPIQTEMGARQRARASAALASSVWLVCRKRPSEAKPGWDGSVLEDMRAKVSRRLREFWDAGLRGPDFVWAATGPALEAYSAHPAVRKADQPGLLTVGEFLAQVRRMVVDFVVGRVLAGAGEGENADRLDEPTAYYLLHRHDFGLKEAPAGACILYAVSCGLTDRDLAATWDLTTFTQSQSRDQAEADYPEEDGDEGEESFDNAGSADSGGKVRLKTWRERRGSSLGYEAPGGRAVPLIDRIHCLMHLWRAGDLANVESYLDEHGLRRHELFQRLLQSLIELVKAGDEERALLESLSNHLQARGAVLTLLPLNGER